MKFYKTNHLILFDIHTCVELMPITQLFSLSMIKGIQKNSYTSYDHILSDIQYKISAVTRNLQLSNVAGIYRETAKHNKNEILLPLFYLLCYIISNIKKALLSKTISFTAEISHSLQSFSFALVLVLFHTHIQHTY